MQLEQPQAIYNLGEFFTWRTAILQSDLPSTTKLVLLVLSCHMNEMGGSCFPSIETLCQETGLSNRAVITHIDHAVERGFIEKKSMGLGGQGWARNSYKATIPDEKGSEPRSPRPQKAVNVVPKGSERSDEKAVNVVHTNSSVNSSYNSPCAFAQFWSVYPKKKSKGQALKAWNKLKPDEQLLQTILRSVERARKSADWLDPKYIPYPATWLAAMGWEDEIVPASGERCAWNRNGNRGPGGQCEDRSTGTKNGQPYCKKHLEMT